MLFSLPSIFRFSGMRMHHFLNKTKTFFFFLVLSSNYRQCCCWKTFQRQDLRWKGFPTQTDAREKNMRISMTTKYQSRKLPTVPQESSLPSFRHSASWLGILKLRGMGGGSNSQNKDKRSPIIASCWGNKTCSKGWRWLRTISLHGLWQLPWQPIMTYAGVTVVGTDKSWIRWADLSKWHLE